MVDVEQVRKTLQKAISILEEKGAPESLKWIEENGVGMSDEVSVYESKDKDDYSNCLHVIRFTYKDNFYEIFLEDMVDDMSITGDYYLRLMSNGEPVFVVKLFEARIILNYESRIKVLKLGKWVDHLPAIVKKEEDAVLKEVNDANRELRRLSDEKEQVWATELSNNLDLGDYE